MAEKAKKEGRVAVKLPRGEARDEAMQFVCVNGRKFWLPKGETSEVPPEIAAEVERSERAERAQDKHKKQLLEKAAAKN